MLIRKADKVSFGGDTEGVACLYFTNHMPTLLWFYDCVFLLFFLTTKIIQTVKRNIPK